MAEEEEQEQEQVIHIGPGESLELGLPVAEVPHSDQPIAEVTTSGTDDVEEISIGPGETLHVNLLAGEVQIIRNPDNQ